MALLRRPGRRRHRHTSVELVSLVHNLLAGMTAAAASGGSAQAPLGLQTTVLGQPNHPTIGCIRACVPFAWSLVGVQAATSPRDHAKKHKYLYSEVRVVAPPAATPEMTTSVYEITTLVN
eukprot:3755144-Pleurochrysis_carterae.AAC.3